MTSMPFASSRFRVGHLKTINPDLHNFAVFFFVPFVCFVVNQIGAAV